MKDKMYTVRFLAVFFLLVLSICSAPAWSRKGNNEIFAFGQAVSGDTTTGSDISFEIEDSFVGGLGAGTNFSDHFNLNADLFVGAADCTAEYTVTTSYYTADATLEWTSFLFGCDINLDVNALKSRITPMATGGIGLITFGGDVIGVAFSETDFSYNIGGGIRWDVTDHILIKALYRVIGTKLQDTDDAIYFTGIYVSLGYAY
jgi:opacity protein-like surface antigen